MGLSMLEEDRGYRWRRGAHAAFHGNPQALCFVEFSLHVLQLKIYEMGEYISVQGSSIAKMSWLTRIKMFRGVVSRLKEEAAEKENH